MQITRHTLAVLAPCAAFVLLGSLWLDLPGMHPDETIFAGPPAWKIELFGREIPVMVMPYIGALKSWIYQLLLLLFPPNAWTLRLPMLLLGAATIGLLYLLAERWFGRGTALLAAWFTATAPSFLWSTRNDWGPVAVQRFLSLAGCWLIVTSQGSSPSPRLFSGFFLLGLGLWDKVSFHWLLLAYGVAAGIAFSADLKRRLTRRTLAAAFAGLILGASPYLAYRVWGPPAELKVTVEADPARYQQKAWMFQAALEGRFARGMMFRDSASDPVWGSLLPWLLLAALFALPATVQGVRGRATLFCLLFPLAAWAQMAPIRDAGSIHHIVLAEPYPQLFLAATLTALAAAWGRAARWIGSALCVALIASNLIVTAAAYGGGLRHGSAPYWSDAIYPLAEQIEQRAPAKVVTLDWGLGNPLRFLFGAEPKIQSMAFPWDWDFPPAQDAVVSSLLAGEAVIVRYADRKNGLYPETGDRLDAAAQAAGLRLRIAAEIRDRGGRVMYHVLEPEPY